VVPRAHALYDLRAVESYRLVHEALAEALQAGGAAAEVKTQCQPSGEEGCAGMAGVCFGRAELYDVVHSRSGLKIAGAAQKRSKHGLLFEGSIARSVAGEVAWDEWEEIFVAQLERRLQLTATPSGWPDWDDEHQALTEHYASPEWLEHR
jgi:lipoyl(octanoyl) transferase